MASDREDRWSGNDEGRDRWDDGRDRRPVNFEAARAKVSAPATLMIVTGVVLLLFFVGSVALIASGFDASVAMLEWMEGMQPPGQPKEDLKKEIEKARNRDRSAEYVQNAIFGTIGLALNVMVLVGGIQMKRLRGRTLAMIGSVSAMIPLNSCCCLGLPVGIWALVVLNNPDVKAAFAANAAGGPERGDPDRGRFDDERDRGPER